MDPFQQETAGSADADKVIGPTTGALVKIITQLSNGGNVELVVCRLTTSWIPGSQLCTLA